MKTLNILKEVEGKGLNINIIEDVDNDFVSTVHIQKDITEYYLKGHGTTTDESSFCGDWFGGVTAPSVAIMTIKNYKEITLNICQDCVKGFKEI